MKEVIQGYTMLVDMYYYRKRLINRYNRIKYYQRHGSVKADSIGFLSKLFKRCIDAFKSTKEESFIDAK